MTEIKRTNYTTGQFLTADDFRREQDYHRTLRQAHNASLAVWGVGNGLDVTKADDTHVAVAPGMALDRTGREIVLVEPATLDLAAQAASRQLYLTIAYQEVQDAADKVQIGGVDAYVATTERPAFGFVDAGTDANGNPVPPPDDAIVLALLTLDGGKIATLNAVRHPLAGSVVPPAIALSSLTVSGTASVGDVLSVANRLECGMLMLDQVSGVTTSFPLGQAVIMNADAGSALEIIGRTVDDGSDGTGGIRALRFFDTVELIGGLKIIANTGCKDPDARAGNLHVAGSMQVSGIYAGGISVTGNISGGGSAFFPSIGATSLVSSLMTITGKANFTSDVQVNGRLLASAKTGYVMDRFVNRLGESLEIGDVVVLGANAPTLAYGPGDSIPVPEVDLTDMACDPRVCGIVCEVHGESAGGDDPGGMKVFTDEERAGMALGTVAPGQLGHMVTLGTFATCKVDADIAPIAAGDLLTTSPTRGHAQKVLDRAQATGAIVGKALAPLAQGRGTIPVLVTLH